jgi:tripartite-type tricarboxylate transporter receptor subunit TctC
MRFPKTVLLMAGLLVLPALCMAQGNYPGRPVKLVVPFAPGGATDLVGRLIAQKLADAMKQQFLVENRGGGGSTVGTEAVAKADPDGYTLVMSTGVAMATAPTLYADLRFQPLVDFAHVARIGIFPNGFVVRADHPARSFAEFISLARASANDLTYASAGQGSSGHLTGELLKSLSGARLVHVPYKGTGPATADLLGGHIDAMFDGMPTATQQVRAGRMRLLAVTGSRRLPTFPDVPTMNEAVPGAIGTQWFGISAPARTPAPVVKQLADEILRIVGSADVQSRLEDVGMTPDPLGPTEFTAYIQSEMRKWEPVIRAARLKAE